MQISQILLVFLKLFAPLVLLFLLFVRYLEDLVFSLKLHHSTLCESEFQSEEGLQHIILFYQVLGIKRFFYSSLTFALQLSQLLISLAHETKAAGPEVH